MSNVVTLRKDKKASKPSFCGALIRPMLMQSSPLPLNFSFLRGASPPKELVPQAIALGLAGIGIADRNSVAGVVRAYHDLEEMKERFRSRAWRRAASD